MVTLVVCIFESDGSFFSVVKLNGIEVTVPISSEVYNLLKLIGVPQCPQIS